MEFKSVGDLVKRGELKGDDALSFCVAGEKICYSVVSDHLRGVGNDNEKIFIILGKDKYDICTAAYGYEASNGFCPECKNKDYRALYRLALVLFAMCGQFKVEKEGKTINIDGKDFSESTIKKALQEYVK